MYAIAWNHVARLTVVQNHLADCHEKHKIDSNKAYLAANVLEYSRAPPIPVVDHDSSASQSLIDVDSPHISSVPSDFDTQSIKTDTQAERIEHEAEDAKIQADQKTKEAKDKATRAKNAAKEKAGLAGKRVKDNADNPVVLGNTVLVALGGLGLGFYAYRKYTAGEFNWRLGGILAGAVGLFAAADIYVSKYVYSNFSGRIKTLIGLQPVVPKIPTQEIDTQWARGAGFVKIGAAKLVIDRL